MTEPVSDALESRIRILSEENDSPCQKLSDGGWNARLDEWMRQRLETL